MAGIIPTTRHPKTNNSIGTRIQRWCLVWNLWQIGRRRAKEGAVNEAQGINDGKQAGQGRKVRQRPVKDRARVRFYRLGEKHLL